MTTYTFCDICMGELDRQTSADELLSIRLTFHGRAKRLDLCDEHVNPSWNVMTAYWTEDLEGQPRAKRGGKQACPVCDVPAARNERGMLMHLNRLHKELPLAERQRLAGMPVTDAAAKDEQAVKAKAARKRTRASAKKASDAA